MHLRLRQAAHVGLALVTASAGLTAGSVANAQYFPYLSSRPYQAYGPADPCARTAAERRLGWGIVGLLAGAWAGGAAAAAGVVAEGAALGGFVGSILGGNAGARSAACGTAALAAAQGSYGPFYGQGYPAQYGGHPSYAVGGAQPVTFYEYRRTYRSFTPCCEGGQPPQGFSDQGGYAQGPEPQYQQQQPPPPPPQQYAPPPQYQPPMPPQYQGHPQLYPRN